MRQTISHRYIYLPNGLGHRIENGEQQTLIGQYNCCVNCLRWIGYLPIGNELVENRGCMFCLTHPRRDTHNLNIDFFIKSGQFNCIFRRKQSTVAFHPKRSFIGRVVNKRRLIVPIEIGIPICSQMLQQFYF